MEYSLRSPPRRVIAFAPLTYDVAGTVTRSIGTGWAGERLLDWTGSGSNIRVYGDNAHHDVTWLADSTGAVSQSLRYDPWGNPRTTVPTGYTPYRFQGSFYDASTDLSWVVTRWYAEAQGRFLTEDSLLGTPADPPSRHLYAYVLGNPTVGWDPDGRAFIRGTYTWDQNARTWSYRTPVVKVPTRWNGVREFLARYKWFVFAKILPWAGRAIGERASRDREQVGTAQRFVETRLIGYGGIGGRIWLT